MGGKVGKHIETDPGAVARLNLYCAANQIMFGQWFGRTADSVSHFYRINRCRAVEDNIDTDAAVIYHSLGFA